MAWTVFSRRLQPALIAAVLLASINCDRVRTESFPFPLERVLVIAHRGGAGLRPENTLVAFQHASDLGADVLELDIQPSADGVFVVIHDSTIDRTTDGRGAVAEKSLEELKKLDAGYHWTPDSGRTFPYRGQGVRIPELQEVLIAFPRMPLSIEIKRATPADIERLGTLLRSTKALDRVLIGSFDPQILASLRKSCRVTVSADANEIRGFYVGSRLYMDRLNPPRFAALQVPEKKHGRQVVTRRFVRAAKHHGIPVYVWTINQPQDMQRLIDLGIDGLITDYPDRLLRILGRNHD